MIINLLSILFLSYYLGAIPFGFLIIKFFKNEDIRTKGSKNIGATNVARIYGLKFAIPTFILDALKGFIPTYFAPIVGNKVGLEIPAELLAVIAGSVAMLGHMFPIFLKFKGGKGVATGAGILFALSPRVFIISFIIWAILTYLFRYVSLASIIAALTMVIGVSLETFINKKFFFRFSTKYPFFFVLLAAILVIFRHRENIKRLIEGKENKF